MSSVNLIVTADDFGRSAEINRAVILAHREGILTSASLMIAGEAADEAVSLARENPTLAVGLHVVAVDGRSILPHDQIPHLVDLQNHFPNAPVRLGLKYAFSPAAHQEIAREIQAQFHRFAATGLPLSHVDGHQHMHVHPTLFKIILPLAKEQGAHGIRLPRDPDCWPSHPAWSIAFNLLSRRSARQMRDLQLLTPQRAFGLARTGQMTQAYVANLLNHLDAEPAEIYFHPTTGSRLNADGPNPGDLQTLLSPKIKQLIQSRNIRLSTYAALNPRRRETCPC